MSEIVVVVTDPLGGGAVGRWAGQLAAAADRGPDRLVADLGGCARIDAAAIVVLLRAHARMVRGNGRLVLRRPCDRVRRTLRLARVDQVLEVQRPEAQDLDPSGLDLPDLDLPGLDLPGPDLPGPDLPGLELPGLELPGLELPGLELPGLELLPGLGVAEQTPADVR